MNKSLFWCGMCFFLLEIIAIVVSAVVLSGINVTNILVWVFAGFVILSMNILAGWMIIKGVKD
jgi:hypothetical protein